MNQIIRELKAASKALRAAAAEVDDISYILGWADGIDHAASILDDSDTSGPSNPYQKRNPYDITVNTVAAKSRDIHDSVSATLSRADYQRNIQDRVNEMVNRSQSYMAHGY